MKDEERIKIDAIEAITSINFAMPQIPNLYDPFSKASVVSLYDMGYHDGLEYAIAVIKKLMGGEKLY